jgi:hypothetical protein
MFLVDALYCHAHLIMIAMCFLLQSLCLHFMLQRYVLIYYFQMKVVPKSAGQTGQRILIPASAPVTQLRAGSNVSALSPTAVNQITSGTTILPSGASSYVMLPAQYVQQVRNVKHYRFLYS